MAKRKASYSSYGRRGKKPRASSQSSLTRRYGASIGSSLSGRKAGYQRTGGFYGRYGRAALAAGLIPENKFFDTALSFAVDTTGEVPATGQLNLIPQGDTESTRDGRQCVLTSIQIRATCGFTPGAGATASGSSHIILVLDKQANGAAAAVTDVLTSNALSGALVNLANSERFTIIKRWNQIWNPSAGVSTAYNTMTKQWEYYKKLNLKLEFSSTTGAITELKSNNLFLLAGSSGVGIDDQVTIAGTCRVRFRG